MLEQLARWQAGGPALGAVVVMVVVWTMLEPWDQVNICRYVDDLSGLLSPVQKPAVTLLIPLPSTSVVILMVLLSVLLLLECLQHLSTSHCPHGVTLDGTHAHNGGQGAIS